MHTHAVPLVVCAAEPFVHDATQASVSLHFQRERSAKRAVDEPPKLMRLWALSLQALLASARCGNRTHCPATLQFAKQRRVSGATLVSTGLVRVDRTERNDNTTRTEGMQQKLRVLCEVRRSGRLAADRQADCVGYTATNSTPLQQLSIIHT